MIKVTDFAHEQLVEYFKNQPEKSPIRIFLNEGGCGGPSLALALDEARENDEAFEIKGFTFLVEKDFLEKAKPIKIDSSAMGFNVTSSYDLGAGSGGCSGCQGSCG